MMFCRIVFTAWLMLGLGLNLGKHGEPRSDCYNFWMALISALIQVLLLWGGGFYG